MKRVLILVSVLLLTACGGGGSSSESGGTSKNVTDLCISERASSLQGFQEFVNNCDFTVNFSTFSPGIGLISVDPLVPGDTDLKVLSSEIPIACRPPSVPQEGSGRAVCS